MIYLLYNPKSNNEHNDINIILKGKSETNVTSISLLDHDVKELLPKLTESDKVLLCGGDGTISRFATNCYGYEFKCPVCVLKSGTGNDFVRDINENETSKIEKLTDIRPYLKNLPTVEVKGIKCKFINGIGFGLDGEVCRIADEQKQISKKKINYTAIALKLLAKLYKFPNAKVTVDGVTREYKKVWLASAMKGRYYGGGMMVSPTQNRDSDVFSVMVFHGGTRLKALSIFPSIYKGGHVKHKEMVDIFKGKHVKVEFDIPTALQIDGETVKDVLTYTAYMDGYENFGN
ncbi:MAG: diacylglycerol kinase family protein [Ruminococcaceae bacterium]|nr:diacylglycerol kinase family protein [Oscillospiraceae bacterium]